MTTTAAKPKSRPPGDAAWRAIVGMHDRVSAIEAALAPAFAAPKENIVAEPDPPRDTGPGIIPAGPYRMHGTSGGMRWDSWPDHDPDYLAGRISLDQARARHARPDEGCGCPNCVHQRKMNPRIVSPEPEPQARCAICHGSGFQGRPEALGWRSCPACDAEVFWALQRASYQGNEYTAPTAALEAARERVLKCEECHGSGRTWEPVPAAPCPACRGTGVDNHVVMPRGVLWPRADGGGPVKADMPGMQQQATHWSARADYLPEPPPRRDPSGSIEPAFATARQHATVPPRPPDGGQVLKGLGS